MKLGQIQWHWMEILQVEKKIDMSIDLFEK